MKEQWLCRKPHTDAVNDTQSASHLIINAKNLNLFWWSKRKTNISIMQSRTSGKLILAICFIAQMFKIQTDSLIVGRQCRLFIYFFYRLAYCWRDNQFGIPVFTVLIFFLRKFYGNRRKRLSYFYWITDLAYIRVEW